MSRLFARLSFVGAFARPARTTAARLAPFALVATACSSGVPLGGPHGGTTALTGPVTASADASEAPEDDAASEVEASPEAATSSSSGGCSSAAMAPADEGGGAPTWTAIFNNYLTICRSCHNQMNTAPSGYSWLKAQGYIAGASSPLVCPSESCLAWFGGNMPPDGTSDPSAVTDMQAWAAAGAPAD